MVDILDQFGSDGKAGVYSYGQIVSVGSGGRVRIRTTSGFELSVRDTGQTYNAGDQVVLGKKDENLNSVFILRKIDRVCRTAVNVIISMDQG